MMLRRFRTLAALAAALTCSGCLIPLPPFEQPVRSISDQTLTPRTPLFLAEASVTANAPPAPTVPQSSPAPTPSTYTCFTPGMPCGDLVINAIAHTQHQILVQSYSFTNHEIAAALIAAAQRGVEVRVIVDRQHAFERGGVMPELAETGIPVLVDSVAGLAHSKVMIFDQRVVITGSYNFTASAEHRNVENLVTIIDSNVAAQYAANWYKREAESR